MTDQFPVTDISEQLRIATSTMGSAMLGLATQIESQENAAKVVHRGEIKYANGSTEVEIFKGVGAKFNWDEHKHNGGVGSRTDRNTGLERPLNAPPGPEGRVAVMFDNGKEMYVQDGVAYIFGKDEAGESALLKSVAVEQLSDITVGMRDSVTLYEFQVDQNIPQATLIAGKPMSVMIESFNPDIA